MKIKYLLIIFGMLLSLALVNAWSTNNLTGGGGTYCYQESANVSTACGGLNTGTYFLTGGWDETYIKGYYLIDGDWSSYAFPSPSSTTAVLVNYTKPAGALSNSLWEVKDDGGAGGTDDTENLTIDTSCWNAYTDRISFNITSNYYGRSRAMWQCWNGTGWTLLRNQSTSKAYEEAMLWSFSSIGEKTTENITFTGNQNITRYLVVPQNTYLTEAYINITGNNNLGSCYQEFANVSTVCGGLNTGTYACAGVWGGVHNCSATIDGDYTSYGYGNDASNSTLYVNYTKPAGAASSSQWQVKDFTSIANLTINSSCWSYDASKVIFKVVSYNTGGAVEWDCYNGTWSTMKRTPASGNVYEESMVWQSGTADNPFIAVDTVKVWNYTGSFIGSNYTDNFANTVNNYLNTCSYSGGYCNVPIIFHMDIAGNLTYSNLLFDNLGVTVNSLTYNSTTSSGKSESFLLNVTYDSSAYSGITAIFNYNNTNYTTTTTGSLSNKLITASLIVPNVLSQTNNTFYFIILLTNSSGTTAYTTQSQNQTVNTFLIDNCGTYTQHLLNFSIIDEESLKLINGTINLAIDFYTTGTNNLVGTYNTSFSYNPTTTSAQVCVNNLTGYDMAYQAQYYGNTSLYQKRYKIVQRMTVTNNSLNQNISLYDVLIASAPCPFQISVSGSSLSTYNSNLLIEVDKQYLAQNQFVAIEDALTDANGNAIAHLIQDTEVYNFIVSYNGLILGTFNNFHAHCVTSATCQCPISLNLATAVATSISYVNYGNVSLSYNFDNNSQTLYTYYFSTDGNSHTIHQIVTADDGYGNTTICDNTTSGTSGTMLCPLPDVYKNTNIWSTIYVDGVFVENKYFSTAPKIDWFGVDILIELLMFSCLVMLFLNHPTLIIIGAVLGFALSILLLSLGTGNFAIMMSVVIFYVAAGVIVIWQIGRRM